VTSHTDDDEENDNKLEDILSSIRGIIENHNPVNEETNHSVEDEKIDEAVLELTSVADNSDSNVETSADGADILLSSEAQKQAEIEFKRYAKSLANIEIKEDQKDCLDDKVNYIMRPLIKDWLDNNLPRIVERIVSEEIKRIVPKS
jgi:cell pole-organizing protein PopZ